MPNQGLSPQLGEGYLLLAFTAVIIGGLGNVRGAFVASLLLGLIESLSSVVLPKVPGPADLLRTRGVPAVEAERNFRQGADLTNVAWRSVLLGTGAFVVIASLPLWANQGLVFLAGLTLIEAVFALSWNLLFGYTGLASFGHAAFFAIGAYLTGAFLRHAVGVPFLSRCCCCRVRPVPSSRGWSGWSRCDAPRASSSRS